MTDEKFVAHIKGLKSQVMMMVLPLVGESAEDIYQEASFKAYRNLKSFKGNSKFGTWFIRIALNEAMMYVRANYGKKRCRQLETSFEQLQEQGFNMMGMGRSPEEILIKKEYLKFLWDWVFKLTQKQRKIFLLKVMEELSVKEIEEITGDSETAIKSTVFHVMRKWKEQEFKVKKIAELN